MRSWFATRPLLLRVLAVALAFVVATVFTLPAEAYTLTTKRWPKRWTTYQFQSNVPNSYRTTIRAAEGDWMQGPNIDFRFDEVASGGKVRVYYGKFNFLPRDGDVIAYASTKNNGLWKTRVDIVIDPDTNWQLDQSGVEVQPGPGEFSLRSVVRHEFGHAAGVGHSQNSNANMFWSFQARERRGLIREDTYGISYYYDSNFNGVRPQVAGPDRYRYYIAGYIREGSIRNEGENSIYYAGGWDRWRGVNASGATQDFHAIIKDKPGAKVFIPYNGRCVTRIYTEAFNRGNVEVRIDGALITTYNERRPGVTRRVGRKFCAGASGKHTIEFRTTCAVSECFMDSDAYFVDKQPGTLAAQTSSISDLGTVTIFQENHEAVEYIGKWATLKADDASAGSLSFTENMGDAVRIAFEGTQVKYCYSKAFNRGKANISIDGQDYEVVDLYGSGVERNQCWVSPKLKPGLHYLHITATGEKQEDSSGTLIDLDHFIVH